MKKFGISAAVIIFLGSVLTSCKSSGPHCAAYTKADAPKVKTVRPV